MYINPKVKQEAEQALGRTLPNPNDDAFDELILELQTSNPEWAARLQRAVIFEAAGDPQEAVLNEEKRSLFRQNLINILLNRREQWTGEQVISKTKMTVLAAVVLVMLVGAGYAVNRPPRAIAAPAEEDVNQVNLDDENSAANATTDAEQDPADELDDELIAQMRESLATSPNALLGASPAEETLPPEPSDIAPAATGGGGSAAGVVASRPAASRSSAVITHREGGQAFVQANTAMPSSAVIRHNGVNGSASVVANGSASSGSSVVATSLERPQSSVVGQTQDAPTATQVADTAQAPPPVSGEAEGAATAQAPPPISRESAGQPDTALATTADASDDPLGRTLARPVPFQERPPQTPAQPKPEEGLVMQVGDSFEGDVAVGLLTADGSALPAIITTDDGAVWRGQATLNNVSRVEIALDQVTVNGQTVEVDAAVFGLDDYPGIQADVSEQTPTLAADLVTSALRGVTDYVDDLASARSITQSNNTIVIDDQVVPLEWAVAGSVANLFSPPRQQRAVVRVAEVPAATRVKVVVMR